LISAGKPPRRGEAADRYSQPTGDDQPEQRSGVISDDDQRTVQEKRKLRQELFEM
jgi:hypothetical protein